MPETSAENKDKKCRKKCELIVKGHCSLHKKSQKYSFHLKLSDRLNSTKMGNAPRSQKLRSQFSRISLSAFYFPLGISHDSFRNGDPRRNSPLPGTFAKKGRRVSAIRVDGLLKMAFPMGKWKRKKKNLEDRSKKVRRK